MRLAAGLCPDPPGELKRSPIPPSRNGGCLLIKGRERKAKRKRKRKGIGKGKGREGERGSTTWIPHYFRPWKAPWDYVFPVAFITPVRPCPLTPIFRVIHFTTYAKNIHHVTGICWKGFQGQRSKVKVTRLQMCERYNGGWIHLDRVVSRLRAYLFCRYFDSVWISLSLPSRVNALTYRIIAIGVARILSAGVHFFLPKKLTTFFVVTLKERLKTPPNLTRPAKTVLKIDSCSGWGVHFVS